MLNFVFLGKMFTTCHVFYHQSLIVAAHWADLSHSRESHELESVFLTTETKLIQDSLTELSRKLLFNTVTLSSYSLCEPTAQHSASIAPSSPADTASGSVASPVIPVAPNIATFLMESDIICNNRWAEMLCCRSVCVCNRDDFDLENHIWEMKKRLFQVTGSEAFM